MKLFCRKLGQGKPVLILHGLFGLSDNWLSIGKRLAQSYQVFILDARNHGRSPHIKILDYQSMVEDIYEFLTDFQLREVILIGHSMGGLTAMNFALEYPHRVERLFVVDIAPKVYPVIHQTIIDALRSIDLSKIKRRSEADQQLAEFIPQKNIRQFLLKNLYRHEGSQYKWRLNLEFIVNNIENLGTGIYTKNAEYTKSTMFIAGGQSNYILEEDRHLISTLFPQYKIVTIPDASHWVHYDQPEKLLDAVHNSLSIRVINHSGTEA
jgi:pimeloyl-ACP methyl ester carboxylesterase